jgi:hypothetical protein
MSFISALYTELGAGEDLGLGLGGAAVRDGGEQARERAPGGREARRLRCEGAAQARSSCARRAQQRRTRGAARCERCGAARRGRRRLRRAVAAQAAVAR